MKKAKRATRSGDNAWNRQRNTPLRNLACGHAYSLTIEMALDAEARDHALIDALHNRLRSMGEADMSNTFIGCIEAAAKVANEGIHRTGPEARTPPFIQHILTMLDTAPRFILLKTMSALSRAVRMIVTHDIGLEIIAELFRLGWRPLNAASDILQEVEDSIERLSSHPCFDAVLAGLLQDCPVPPMAFNIAIATSKIGRADLGKDWLRKARETIALEKSDSRMIYNLTTYNAFISKKRSIRAAATLAAWIEIERSGIFTKELVAGLSADFAGLLSKTGHERMRAIALARSLGDPALLP